MRIVALTENTCHSHKLDCEHGLSLYIQTEDHRILFDMGQSDLFLRNAERLGVDLTQVDFAVISHGHYDHGGGLSNFLQMNSTAPVFIAPSAFDPHYNAVNKYIGLDSDLAGHERLRYIRDTSCVTPGITLININNQVARYPLSAGGLQVQLTDGFRPDDFCHEQYLLIEERGKRILFSGCSHKGIQNIMNCLRPDILIGGFHFSKLPMNDTLSAIAQDLNAYSTTYYTCHCTGTEQYAFLKQYISRLHYLSCGDEIII